MPAPGIQKTLTASSGSAEKKREAKIKRQKKKGPATGKPIGPKRKAEAKRFLKSKQEELNSQEARLFLKFAETHPQADLTLPVVGAIWSFLKFLKMNGDHIIDEKTVFCFPFSRMVKLKDFK